jgi:N-glycosylase/DNA lyase
MTQLYFLEKPRNFSFKYTVFSHGWYDLLPFELDAENWRLSYVFSDKKNIERRVATVFETENRLKIEVSGDRISERFKKKILRDVRHILRLDDDLSKFYKLAKREKEFAWIAENNAGRLLRSPTVFEDMVKTVCTTNCSWALTKKMVANLVEKLGEETAVGKHAFPTAEKMASVTAEFYRGEIRAGYRASYFAELAEKVASGKIKPESWLQTNLSTSELKKEMKQIKGVGDYAAENLLKLVGRYEGLALDSWLRAQFYKKHAGEKVCADKEIESFYERFGDWRGLALWCDMTERWFDKT